MPFKIVRNHITKVKADVIVNTANPNPVCASGTDLAIYEAAGKEELLAERAGIGKIARGDIAVTGAYNLKAKYIIHTVGPVWTDGKHHEFEILENCYRKSLQKALEFECESIAFPLISTEVYGFPKDKALQIAVSVFSRFLTENEMEIILVVFDKRSFQLSGQIVGDIDSYIDANYVRESHRKEYPLRSRRSTRIKELAEEDFNEEMLQREEDNYPLEEMTDTGMTELLMPLENISLEDQLANIGASFHDKLFELIEEAHLDNKDVWKRANLDRKHFSKIQLVYLEGSISLRQPLCLSLKSYYIYPSCTSMHNDIFAIFSFLANKYNFSSLFSYTKWIFAYPISMYRLLKETLHIRSLYSRK